jgi:hypothetical protein
LLPEKSGSLAYSGGDTASVFFNFLFFCVFHSFLENA